MGSWPRTPPSASSSQTSSRKPGRASPASETGDAPPEVCPHAFVLVGERCGQPGGCVHAGNVMCVPYLSLRESVIYCSLDVFDNSETASLPRRIYYHDCRQLPYL